jgi:hypothetical protein
MTTHGHRLNDKLLNQLTGNVHFVRVSMDGVGAVYESIRGRSFDNLLQTFNKLRDSIPFGINYVVNSKTKDGLSDAANIAQSAGASELLLLPEVGFGKGTGIDNDSLTHLKAWVSEYSGALQLSISSGHAHEFPATPCLEKEPQALAFAHIDAKGCLKRTSFDLAGQPVSELGVMQTFKKLYQQHDGACL